MRCSFLVLLLLAGLANPAWAEGAAKPKKPEPGTTVEMPFLVVPMSQDGKLLGYAYISSKLVCTAPAACLAVREKIAFIQDANVREVNTRPVSLASDPTAVDKDLLNARLTANAKRIVGDAKVQGMVFMTVQYTPLRASDSTASPSSSQPQPAAASGGAQPPASGAPESGATQPSKSSATSKPSDTSAH